MNIDYEFQEQGRGLAKGSGHLEEAFFERIYINREVVQEARHVAICVLGRINEPINSSSEVIGNGTVSDCFLKSVAFLLSICFFTIKSGRFVLNRLFKV